jgi:hypothetical protein
MTDVVISSLITATSALPELSNVAEAEFTLLCPCADVTAPGLNRLLSAPIALVVTSTDNSQVEPLAILPPVTPATAAPGTAFIMPLQLPLAAVKLALAGD